MADVEDSVEADSCGGIDSESLEQTVGEPLRRAAWVVGLALMLAPMLHCSIKRLAINSLADSLAETGDLYAAEEDPELVRDAAPFGLKTMEALLGEVPEHVGLLLSACQGFTQYSYAFVETDALLAEERDFEEAQQLRARALRLYLRARDYCLRGLEQKHPGITERLRVDPVQAVQSISAAELPLLFWTGAAWGSAISIGLDRPALVADFTAVSSLMRRALEIDETYAGGAVHEVFIMLESLPEAMGGSEERAREHFERALELSGGKSAGAYVILAANVSVANQDREEFERLLEQALRIDPDEEPSLRLQNLIVQRRARYLLEHVDDLILDLEADEENP